MVHFILLVSTPLKKVREFPVPSRDVTTKLSLGRNNDVIIELFLPRGSLFSDIPAGDGKLVNLYLQCNGLWNNGWVWKRCYEGLNGLAGGGGGSFNIGLGYNNINNLVLPGRWWLQYFILIHIYEKSFPFFSAVSSAFAFKVEKSAKITPTFLSLLNAIWVSINAEFDADFESIEKVEKQIMRKKLSTKKWQTNRVLEFYLWKRFRPVIF